MSSEKFQIRLKYTFIQLNLGVCIHWLILLFEAAAPSPHHPRHKTADELEDRIHLLTEDVSLVSDIASKHVLITY